jgi:hypothetical protein
MSETCRVVVDAGVCRKRTLITAEEDMGMVHVDIKSECPNVLRLSWGLKPISAFSEVEAKISESEIYRLAEETIPHAACPVMSGIIKAIEVAGNLGLKRDCSIHFLEEGETSDVR